MFLCTVPKCKTLGDESKEKKKILMTRIYVCSMSLRSHLPPSLFESLPIPFFLLSKYLFLPPPFHPLSLFPSSSCSCPILLSFLPSLSIPFVLHLLSSFIIFQYSKKNIPNKKVKKSKIHHRPEVITLTSALTPPKILLYH